MQMRTWLLGIILIAAYPLGVSAADITVMFQGDVAHIENDLLPAPFQVGDPVTITGTYDDQTPNTSVNPLNQLYLQPFQSWLLNIGNGSYQASGTAGTVTLLSFVTSTPPDHLLSIFMIGSESNDGPLNGHEYQSTIFTFRNSIGTPLTGVDLTTFNTLGIADFPSAHSATSDFGAGANGGNVTYNITNITFSSSPVPTPSAMLLMGSGLIGLVGWRWWSTKKAQA